jgi:hypothetical protein
VSEDNESSCSSDEEQIQNICDHDSKTFVHLCFAKPGIHTIIIFDPESQSFFKKVLLVPFNNDHPQPFVAGE